MSVSAIEEKEGKLPRVTLEMLEPEAEEEEEEVRLEPAKPRTRTPPPPAPRVSAFDDIDDIDDIEADLGLDEY